MALSGHKTITTAGTAEALGSQRICGPLMVKALTTNAGLAYLGNDGAGDVSSNLPVFQPSNVPTFKRANSQTFQPSSLPAFQP